MLNLLVNVALSRFYLMLEKLLIGLWLVNDVFELVLLILLFNKCINWAKNSVVTLALPWLTVSVMVILNEILKRAHYKVPICRKVRWLVSLMLFFLISRSLLIFFSSIVWVLYFLYSLLDQALLLLLLQLIFIRLTAIRKCIR